MEASTRFCLTDSGEILSSFKLVWYYWSWWFYNNLYQPHFCSLLFFFFFLFTMNLTVTAWICKKNVIYSMTNLMFSSSDSLKLKESIPLQRKRCYLTKINILQINLWQSYSPSNKNERMIQRDQFSGALGQKDQKYSSMLRLIPLAFAVILITLCTFWEISSGYSTKPVSVYQSWLLQQHSFGSIIRCLFYNFDTLWCCKIQFWLVLRRIGLYAHHSHLGISNSEMERNIKMFCLYRQKKNKNKKKHCCFCSQEWERFVW